jgi:hypothetical protein
MRTFILLAGFLFCLNAHAGFLFKDLEFLSMENFTVDNKDDRVVIGFDYVIKNPNWYAIYIKPSTLQLTVANVDCGWVKIKDKIKIERLKKGSYPFVLEGDGSKFVKSGFMSIWLLLSGQDVGFNLRGKLNAGVAFFKRKWKMDYTYKMTFEEFLMLF